MKTAFAFAALVALCAPLAAQAADAATPAIIAAAAPVEKFSVGPMLVERHGSGARPMILIPGLSSGPYVWADTVRQFSKDHTLYVLTLPGFNGHPKTSGDLVAGADGWIGNLIGSRKLHKPVLVGHSMGAALSIAYAGKHPEQVGGVIAIDGLPVFPGAEKMTAEQRLAMASQTKARMAGVSQETFAAQQQAYMRSAMGVMDTATADAVAARSAQSDAGAVFDYMAQVLAMDVRPTLPGIGVPVLLIVPFHEGDAKAAGMAMTAEGKAGYYKSLMAGTPKLTVLPVSPARHFAMLDQPEKVAEAMREYLKGL